MADVMHTYYEFEVSLQEAEPRVWRRFLLRADLTFYDLHKAIQDACGWLNYHLFAFQQKPRGETIAKTPNYNGVDVKAQADARRVNLSAWFDKKKTCLYIYDFGDNWVHKVMRVAKVELPQQFDRALLDGQRAFPPEDCGGMGNYWMLLGFFETGVQYMFEEPEELRDWLGDWTPEDFNLEVTKRTFDK